MMPANIGSLPELDEATTPFSSLFTNHFDRATVEATVPLADKTIFVANGRRFLFESIPDPTAEDGRTNQTGSRRGSAQPSVHGATPASPSARGAAPMQTQPGLSTDYLALNNAAARRRPPPAAGASSQRAPPGPRLSEYEVSRAATTPRVVTEDVIQGMSNLNIHRFSATPFFAHSDGGVAAAEALTDLDPVPRLPIPQSPAPQSPSLPHSYSSPAINIPPNHQGSSYPAQSYTERPYAGRSPSGTSIQPANTNYQYHVAHMDPEHHRSMPSLMEHSSPVPYSTPTNHNMYISPNSPPPQSSYDGAQYGQVSPNFGQYPSHPSPAVTHLHSPQQGEPRRWSEGSTSYYGGQATSPAPPTVRHYSIPAGESHYDTQTPVIVIDPRPQPTASNSSRSDGASTGRDNVLPGEDILYDGFVKMTQDLSTPFLNAFLKVFRNTLSHDLRFHCRVGYETETYWMKGANAQLIPVYAYDQRFPNVLYIKDNDSDTRNLPGPQGNTKPGGFYQFNRLQELCDFQAKLTGEKVVLDISSVRLMRVRKASSRSNESFSSVRVQIWHEEGTSARRGTQSDVASFVTAGTALSGPMRNKQVPNSSRLMVFLGRLDEFITVFITDDIEVVAEGQTMVRVRPRKGSKFSKRGGSRWPGVKGMSCLVGDVAR